MVDRPQSLLRLIWRYRLLLTEHRGLFAAVFDARRAKAKSPDHERPVSLHIGLSRIDSDWNHMKMPQRKFVVEFKSPRRQARARANSIWGDTDLNALAREAADDAPYLFEPDRAPGSIGVAETGSTNEMNSPLASEDKGDVQHQAETASSGNSEPDVTEVQQAGSLAPEELPQAEQTQPAVANQKTSRGRARKTARHPATRSLVRISADNDDGQSGISPSIPESISIDRLAALDEENKRLRKLLANQLHAENRQLKKMLVRFDAS